MGGFGSGRYQHGKNTVDDYCRLDVRLLQRDGFLKPGRRFGWQWKYNNGSAAFINIQVDIDKITLSHKQRSTGDDWKYQAYPVWLDWTWCNYGNYRTWFLCPVKGCGRRVAILYAGAIFACRHCYKLTYPCQREATLDRRIRRTERIRRKLGWEPGILNPISDKPKGMHWHTFEKLSYQHNVSLMESLEKIREQLGLRDKV
jgi:hypothetical protein